MAGEGVSMDANVLAKHVVDQAVGLKPKDPEPTGRQRSGKARASNLTPEQRNAIARKAAKARWSR